MAAKQHKRLSKELENFGKEPLEGVTIDLVADNMVNWNVHLNGPKDTPYAGGKFTVNIDFSDNYPFKCPKIQFVTKIYHPTSRLTQVKYVLKLSRTLGFQP